MARSSVLVSTELLCAMLFPGSRVTLSLTNGIAQMRDGVLCFNIEGDDVPDVGQVVAIVTEHTVTRSTEFKPV